MAYRDNRTKDMFRYLCHYEMKYGFAPTLSEIAEHEGFNSNAGVIRHLDKLEKWGWIERHHGQARSIRILRTCDDLDRLKSPNEDTPRWSHLIFRRQ